MFSFRFLLSMSFVVGCFIQPVSATQIAIGRTAYVVIDDISSPVPPAPTVDPAAATVTPQPTLAPKPAPVAVRAAKVMKSVCPNCGKVHGAVQPQRTVSVDQAWAQREANLQASRGRMGHLMGCSPNARFSGVGMGGSPNCNTCTPRRGMTLIGDASAQGRNGRWYRSRHWR